MGQNLANLVDSLKGISGSGNILSQFVKLSDSMKTLEPGDVVNPNLAAPSTAPTAYDLWYLMAHNNFLSKYNSGIENFDGDVFDYTTYLTDELSCLNKLIGLKPLKVLRNLDQIVPKETGPFFDVKMQYTVGGIYWTYLIAFELINKSISFKWDSDPSTNLTKNDLVGYITFPVGQLGVMEIISLIKESRLSGYTFTGGLSPSTAGYTLQPADTISADEMPIVDEPTLFPKQSQNGLCYGEHIIEKSYLKANDKVELLSARIDTQYGEDVSPKNWIRYWINKDDLFPVPGDFIGILCKPLSVPTHLWWFQKSMPFLYAGNWMETKTLTSGVITDITLEEDRTDEVNDGVGNIYFIKIQGCEVAILSSDFFQYAIGEKVAIVKIDGVSESKAAISFSWIEQNETILKIAQKADKEGNFTVLENYTIVPITFYIKK